MARARNIKPAFFTDDEVAELAPIVRLLFIGLWTLADREGRLEDRPKRIKAELLPYDDADVDLALAALADRGFIVRYQVDGARFIQVRSFAKHQNPHVREPASVIPAPGEHGASTVQARCEALPKPEPAGRIPDSGFPLPDSPLPPPEGGSAQSPPECSPAGSPPSPARGSRIPDGFPDADALGWCRSERPDLDSAVLAAKFRDYWLGVPGQRGRKADWPATWRNFVRSEFARPPPSRASPTPADRRAAFVASLTAHRTEPPSADPRTIDVDFTEPTAPRLAIGSG